MSFTVDDNTVASSPGAVEISKNKFLDYFGFKGISWLRYSILLSLKESYLYKSFGDDKIVFKFIGLKEQFRYGCLNPTVVVNSERGLIATHTNLAMTESVSVPVIKISKEPLHLIKNIKVTDGQQLPTVSLYQRNMEDDNALSWKDFDPKIVNCFTDSIDDYNRLLTNLSKEQWFELYRGLATIEDKLKEGLYFLE